MDNIDSPSGRLRLLTAGLATRIVDLGRPRSRGFGVPIGGAADRTAYAVGNALVGNDVDAAALEITLAGPTLESTCDLACVLFGAPFDLTSSSSTATLKVGKTFTLRPGDLLTIGGTASGARAYLCIQGGIQTPMILGSRSSFQPLAAGAELPCVPSATAVRSLDPGFQIDSDAHTLHALAGVQADWFDQKAFYGQEYNVTPASDRMGLRLKGIPLVLPERELVSEPVCPGAVQVTRDGQPIVLGIDGQTIGGYPKVAQVISADLDKLAQLRPNSRVRFVLVTLTEAEECYRRKKARAKEWLTRLRTAARFGV